jgi:two-component system OmpR family sensor kinase
VRDAQVAAPSHHWQLDLPEEPVVVEGDGHALHQALANLLSNAQTHTPDGTTTTVAVADAGDDVRMSVSDDGPGMPVGLASRAFERFTHGVETNRPDTGGSGLGLSIVAAIVAAHGGTPTVNSSVRGTTFTILLPRKQPGHSADSTHASM